MDTVDRGIEACAVVGELLHRPNAAGRGYHREHVARFHLAIDPRFHGLPGIGNVVRRKAQVIGNQNNGTVDLDSRDRFSGGEDRCDGHGLRRLNRRGYWGCLCQGGEWSCHIRKMRDRLPLTVFENDEVFRSEIRNVPSGGIRDGSVDLNEIDGDPNDGVPRRALCQDG